MLSKKMHKRKVAGLTFTEILLVVSLLGIVSLGIYNSLSHGLRIWSKSQHINIEEDVLIFFDKLAQDLGNSFELSELTWSGDSNELSFPTIVQVQSDAASSFDQNEYAFQPGEATYLYNPERHKLFRREASYGQVKNEKFDENRVIVSALKSVSFRYYYPGAEGGAFVSEMKQKPPHGILVEVEFIGKNQIQTMNRFFDILGKNEDES